MLQACLGISVDALGHRVVVRAPALPSVIDRVSLRGLRTSEGSVDLTIHRHLGVLSTDVERRSGHLDLALL
jgi:hypothetical protein